MTIVVTDLHVLWKALQFGQIRSNDQGSRSDMPTLFDCSWSGPNSPFFGQSGSVPCIGYMRSIAIQGTALD